MLSVPRGERRHREITRPSFSFCKRIAAVAATSALTPSPGAESSTRLRIVADFMPYGLNGSRRTRGGRDKEVRCKMFDLERHLGGQVRHLRVSVTSKRRRLKIQPRDQNEGCGGHGGGGRSEKVGGGGERGLYFLWIWFF